MKKFFVKKIMLLFVMLLWSQNIFAQWSTSNKSICTASGNQKNPAIAGTRSGGAIIVWEDYRNGSSNADIYAQCIDASGVV